MDQQVLMARNPAAIRKMRHDTAVQATGCAQVQILDAGVLTQGRELEPRVQFFAVSFGGFAVDEDAETLFECEIIEDGRPALFFKRLGNAGQAEGQQSVMSGMGQHFGPFSVVIAAAANVGVLEEGSVFRAFQECAIEAILEDRTN
jgi:hypothetical protein